MSASIGMKVGGLATMALGLALLVPVHAEEQQQAAPARLEIVECLVFSETDQTKRFDCTVKARELCASGPARRCALPIGLVLSGGRDLDGNRDTWEKVRVNYRCGKVVHTNGPHHQNDHATMLLACGG
ncbi:MAG: hypothetical protein ABI885_23630 [Gammaproteobacteria bacterium]